ncbi:MAG: DUF262 domain-containing protein [Fibrobacteraceae bacterium]|nr:DUF262 domain-containing protein [Fibrobacteraceae bacterium]
MKKNNLPLTNASIKEIYYEGQTQNIYQVPIYQRNYAWEDTEINALVKDVFDSYEKSKKAPEKDSVYYIGTLVTYKRNDNNFEVIDGQQRLTTIYLILKALEENPKNKLTYSARKKSKDTIEQLPKLPEVYDEGIKNGFGFAQNAIKEIVGDKKDEFKKYFLNNVRIIHYQVPKDVDLNHYFEVMNSRGEQLEKHEIIKARLSEHLRGNDLKIFSEIWESCSDMNRYIQQKYKNKKLFGEYFSSFNDDINIFEEDSCEKLNNKPTIKSLLDSKVSNIKNSQIKENSDSFQSIIDFPNFLLIVLKLTRILKEDNFIPEDFSLDDKELINEFDKFGTSTEDAKLFINNLIKAKYFLDNYIVHHVDSEKENVGDNPWELEYYHVDGNNRHPKNLSDNKAIQYELVHLLSLLEVTFTAKQRKNYLFYCLLYLFQNDHTDIESYCNFVRNLVHKMFYDIYLNSSNLNEINNLPKPNAFDSEILNGKKIELTIQNKNPNFSSIYKEGSMNIPLFVFNFTDYKIWVKYANEIRGNQTKKDDKKRISFFEDLGCSDFDLEPFNSFYFSRTRKSLEHYYPQAKAGENGIVSEKDINRFGNFAMISANANSSGSDWDPKTKLEHYTDKKSDPVGVASLKFKIMMQICSDNSFSREKGLEWILEDMNQHQEKMMKIILEN